MECRWNLCLIIALVLLISTGVASVAGANEVFNVKDYGAVGDGKTVNTAAIKKAIEAADSSRGGTVLFPSGEWMSGKILMKSNLTLKITPDATLLAAPGPIYGVPEGLLDALIWGDGLENVTITGGGVIEGKFGLTRDPGPAGTGRRIIAFQRCRNLKITNVSLRHGAHTTLHLRSVDGIELGYMKVESFWDRDPNGGGDGRDGAIFDGCRNVHVYDSVFKGSDDAFSFKARASGFKTVSENFKIERCTFASRSSNAIQFGSETLNHFRNIEIVDAKIEHAGKAGIGITMNDGAVIENVRYRNVEIRNACAPIFIHIRDRNGAGKIRNVRFDNITAPVISSISEYKKRSPHGYWVATISGLKEHPVENIVFNNLTLIYPGGINETADKIAPPYPPLDYQPRKMGMRPASGFYIRHARDIESHNLKIVHEKPDLRPAIVADSAEGILIDGAILPKSDDADCHVLVRGGWDVEVRKSGLTLKNLRNSQALRIHWLPLTMDQEYIEDCVKLAREFDVDAFHLSHTIVHDAEDVIEDTRRRSEVLKAMKTMKDAGLEIWCWTHEIKKLPPGIRKGQFSLRDPLLEKFLQDKYDNFVTEVLPGLDGIVLTLAETGVKVYQNVTAEEARRNVSDLVGVLGEPLSRHDVRLAVRSFVYKKKELDIVEAATSEMPAGVAVMSKIYPHDWQPYYPFNPIIGAVGERQQWVEFDLGFEFEGQNTVPYSDPHGWIRQLNHSWDKGIRTVCLRLDRCHGNEGKSAISTPWGMLNLTVFSEFKKNRNVKAAEIISKWEQGQFPGAWKILEISTAITRCAMYPKKQWYQNHSVIPDYGYAKSHLKGGSADRLATWSGLAEDRRSEDLCDRPTPEWYRQILAEDMQNQRDLEQIEEILSENKVDLSKYPVWEKGIKALRMNAELYAASKKAYFAMRLHQNMPEAMPKENAAACIDDFERVVERLDPLPEYARCRKYQPGSTLPKAVRSLRKELTKTPRELSLSDVPSAVHETIRRQFGDTLVDIKTKTRDGRLVFEVDGRIDGSDAEINVFEDGTIRNRK